MTTAVAPGAGVSPGCMAKVVPTGMAKVVPTALGPQSQGAALGMGKSLATKGMVAGGAGAGCKGLSLGLGIGLGFWGPVVLAGLGAAAAYSLWKSRGAAAALNEDDMEMSEALSSR